MVLCCALTYRGAIDTMEAQTVGGGDASALAPEPPSPTRQGNLFGVQPGNQGVSLASQWGVQSQILPERERKRIWGAQPSTALSNIWDNLP
jgi:hypothetical protein